MRLIVPAAAALAFAVFTMLFHLRPDAYAALLEAWAVPIGEIPFIDFHAVLAAIECHRLGEDVYTVNPCDLIGRPHVYSPAWLVLPIPAATSHTAAWGIGLALAFFAALASLPLPRQPLAIAMMLAAVLSPSVFLAVERANNDMMILLIAIASGHLAAGRPAARMAGYGLLIAAALLKYYPAVALAVAAREQRPVLLAVAAAGMLAAGMLVTAFAGQWEQSARLLQWVLRFGLYTFSLRNPIEYAALYRPDLLEQPLHGLLMLVLLAAFAGLVWVWHTRFGRRGLRLEMTRPADALLAVSGLIVAGCFVSGSSLPYRAVLLLPALPALLVWGRRYGEARLLALLVVFLLWLPLLHHAAAGGGEAARVYQALLIAAKEIGWWLTTSAFVALTVPLLLNQLRLRNSA